MLVFSSSVFVYQDGQVLAAKALYSGIGGFRLLKVGWLVGDRVHHVALAGLEPLSHSSPMLWFCFCFLTKHVECLSFLFY